MNLQVFRELFLSKLSFLTIRIHVTAIKYIPIVF